MSQINFPYQPVDIQPQCNIWTLRCPLIIYIALVILSIIWHLTTVNNLPLNDRNGNLIPVQRRNTAITFGFIIMLIIDLLFGIWIYSLCKKCQYGGSWLVFLLAIFFPLVIALIIFVITLLFLGITSFVTRS